MYLDIDDIRYNRTSETYFIKDKYDGQTYEMGFEIDASYDICYVNVYARIYSKRKHSQTNEDSCAMTGKHPMHSYVFFKEAFDLLEEKMLHDAFYYRDYYKKLIIAVNWTDARRRDAYYKILNKKGYYYQNLFGGKCIAKIFTKEDYKKFDFPMVF